MIISLAEAQGIDSSITQADLDAFEQSIRQLTANTFQVKGVRGRGITINGKKVTITHDELTKSIIATDTLELYGAGANDGLYVVESITDGEITLDRAPRVSGTFSSAILSLVVYPADIRAGVIKLIEYDKKMGSKVGIKSETISRMSTTYYDATASESTSGYPASLMNFIKKYEKMRWG